MLLKKTIAGADQPFFTHPLFLRLFQKSPQSKIVIDANWKIIAVNRAGLELFGYAEEQQLVGQPLTMLMLPSQQAEHARFVEAQKVVALPSRIIGKNRELPAVKADGTVFSILLAVTEEMEGTSKYYLGEITDLSVFKEKQSQVEKVNESLSTILNSSRDFIFVLNHKGEFLEVYTRSKEHLFVPYEQLLGKHYRDCLPQFFPKFNFNAINCIYRLFSIFIFNVY
jgi:PAS domain S-box-containing protein